MNQYHFIHCSSTDVVLSGALSIQRVEPTFISYINKEATR